MMHFNVGKTEEAQWLVKKFHYSHRVPSNVQMVATLHRPGGLFGDCGEAIAAVFFSIPPTRWSEPVLELSRLVRDESAAVELSRLISFACRELAKRRVDLVISFADSQVGHHGGIYQACSWRYHGKREAANDGLIINGRFVPGRSCNIIYGTRSVARLKELHGIVAEEHFDEGKHLYWRALSKAGAAKAERLKLESNPYPKPDHTTKDETDK